MFPFASRLRLLALSTCLALPAASLQCQTPPNTPATPPGGSAWFDDDFKHHGCARAATVNGFGWGPTGTGGKGAGEDSVHAVSNPASPSGCGLAFIFQADPSGGDGWAEQRFTLGKIAGGYPKEVFVGMVIKSPANYFHRKDTGPNGNKLFRMWDLSYNGSAVQVGLGNLPRGSAPGESNILVDYTDDTQTGNHNLGPWTRSFVAGHVDTIGFYIKTSTGVGTADGIVRLWWNRVLVYDHSNLVLARNGKAGSFNAFANGYMFGWSNAGFNVRTQMELWRFILAPATIDWFLPR